MKSDIVSPVKATSGVETVFVICQYDKSNTKNKKLLTRLTNLSFEKKKKTLIRIRIKQGDAKKTAITTSQTKKKENAYKTLYDNLLL